MQEIVDETIKVIPTLSFTHDAFSDVGPEVVELVLRDVSLKAAEIEVWRAVKEWADGFFDDLSDPDFSPTCSPTQAEESGPVVPEALKMILQFIDLDCISWKEVVDVCCLLLLKLWPLARPPGNRVCCGIVSSFASVLQCSLAWRHCMHLLG
jgi:hypothetical protein